jgi:hypothetical protein
MLIEVVMVGWEQGCCGASFSVGAEATWQLLAAEPGPGGLPRFVEEHHGETPADVEHVAVTGMVTAITGITYPQISVPGHGRTKTTDLTRPQPHELGAVAARAEGGFSEYRVTLDVADDATLPGPAVSAEQAARHDLEARTAARRLARMADEVGLLLEALADDAKRRFAGVARLSRATEKSAVTIDPHRAGAAGVSWVRSGADEDGITVQAGDGRWQFPASVAHARIVALFLDAAIAGRIEEHVRPAEDPSRLDTEVLAADGRSWTATVPFAPFVATGFVAMPGQLWKRVQRGEHRYLPWQDGADQP